MQMLQKNNPRNIESGERYDERNTYTEIDISDANRINPIPPFFTIHEMQKN